MQDNVQKYISVLKQTVYNQISFEINPKSVDRIVKDNLIKAHLENKGSASFQEYYFTTLDNEKLFFSSTDFFRQFKNRYSLQGIDNNYLDGLEKQKKEILKQIRADKLAQLYFTTFNKIKIKYGKEFKEKNLSSFFAKLVHTFNPKEYCALDNPIKDHFGLKKESFFISFFIISVEYKHWTKKNRQLIKTIREKFKQADKNKIIKHSRMTDLKLLDLIFWSKANLEQITK